MVLITQVFLFVYMYNQIFFIVNTKIPKVVYASRTHSQLSQVVHELKKTAYQ